MLPIFKSWTFHKIIVEYLTLALLSSLWNIYHSTTAYFFWSTLYILLLLQQWRQNYGDRGVHCTPKFRTCTPCTPQVKDAAFVKILSKQLQDCIRFVQICTPPLTKKFRRACVAVIVHPSLNCQLTYSIDLVNKVPVKIAAISQHYSWRRNMQLWKLLREKFEWY